VDFFGKMMWPTSRPTPWGFRAQQLFCSGRIGREDFRGKKGIELDKPQNCSIICDAAVFRKERDENFNSWPD